MSNKDDFDQAMSSAEELVDNYRRNMKRLSELEGTMSIREQLENRELAQIDADLRSLQLSAVGTLMGLVDALRKA